MCFYSAASHSLKSFFAMPSMQQLAGHRWVPSSEIHADIGFVKNLFLFALSNTHHSRSKLAFTRGTPSDSIGLVNAFKVMYCQWVQWIYISDWCLFLKPLPILLSGMAVIQKERTAETPKGDGNTDTFKIWFSLCPENINSVLLLNRAFSFIIHGKLF